MLLNKSKISRVISISILCLFIFNDTSHNVSFNSPHIYKSHNDNLAIAAKWDDILSPEKGDKGIIHVALQAALEALYQQDNRLFSNLDYFKDCIAKADEYLFNLPSGLQFLFHETTSIAHGQYVAECRLTGELAGSLPPRIYYTVFGLSAREGVTPDVISMDVCTVDEYEAMLESVETEASLPDNAEKARDFTSGGCSVYVLAGGYGERMGATRDKPKSVFPVYDRPLYAHTIDRLYELGLQTTLLTGFGAPALENSVEQRYGRGVFRFVGTPEPDEKKRNVKNTGSMFLPIRDILHADPNDIILVVNFDDIYPNNHFLTEVIEGHIKISDEKVDATVIAVNVDNPEGFGRVVRKRDDGFALVVEPADFYRDSVEVIEQTGQRTTIPMEEVKKIREINTNVIAFNKESLLEALNDLEGSDSGFNIVDVLGHMVRKGQNVQVVVLQQEDGFIACNTQEDIRHAEDEISRWDGVNKALPDLIPQPTAEIEEGRKLWEAMKKGQAQIGESKVERRESMPDSFVLGRKLYYDGITIIIPYGISYTHDKDGNLVKHSFDEGFYFVLGRQLDASRDEAIKFYHLTDISLKQVKAYLLSRTDKFMAEVKRDAPRRFPGRALTTAREWSEFYKNMERQFPKAYEFNQQAHPYTVKRIIDLIKMKRARGDIREFNILHVGSGDAKLLRMLEQAIQSEMPDIRFHLWGVDISAETLSGLIDEPNLTVVEGSATTLSCLGEVAGNDFFDIIVDYGLITIGALYEPDSISRALKKWSEALKSGGYLVSVPCAPSALPFGEMDKYGFNVVSRCVPDHFFEESRPIEFYTFRLGAESLNTDTIPTVPIKDEIRDITKEVSLAGLEIPTNAYNRYKLIVPFEFFGNDDREFNMHELLYGDRFYLDYVSDKDKTRYVDKVLTSAAKFKDRAIALVPDDTSVEDLEILKQGGVRFIRVNLDMLLHARIEEEGYKHILHFQQNAYAMMLLARRIGEVNPESSIYKTLSFFVKTHFALDGVETADYIKAIVDNKVAILIKGILAFRPAEAYDIPEYYEIAPALTSA